MATRARILTAARRLSRTGERPTLAEVAQAAGVSRATVHRVVGSRADLLHGKRCRLDVIPQHDPQWIAAGKTNRPGNTFGFHASLIR